MHTATNEMEMSAFTEPFNLERFKNGEPCFLPGWRVFRTFKTEDQMGIKCNESDQYFCWRGKEHFIGAKMRPAKK